LEESEHNYSLGSHFTIGNAGFPIAFLLVLYPLNAIDNFQKIEEPIAKVHMGRSASL
jgi:hypothetical protein